jgi:hypothetical protein
MVTHSHTKGAILKLLPHLYCLWLNLLIMLTLVIRSIERNRYTSIDKA